MIVCSLGHGYVSKYLLKDLASSGVKCFGITNKKKSIEKLSYENISLLPRSMSLDTINRSTHLLVSAPPNESGCPIFTKFNKYIKNSNIRSIIYVSTTGVYGDHNGKWVNEKSELNGKNNIINKNRINAEKSWINFCTRNHILINVVRLGAIYGPGRPKIEKKILIDALIKNNHFFSRIHVQDIARLISKILLNSNKNNIWNIVDETPSTRENFLNRIIEELLPERIEDYKVHGRRNIANTTTAPAGSVSCLTQTTSGIEPAFMLHYTRRKKINPDSGNVRVDFVDDLGDQWQEYTVYHHGFKKWLESTDPECEWHEDDLSVAVSHSPYSGATANEIDWENKVHLQAAAQKWVCHAISNTTNLPAEVDVETVKKVYELGWKTGCKGITIYRDGSRSGVLVNSENKESEKSVITRDAPKRPSTLSCDIHHTSVKGERWVVLVGLLDGIAYEVMGGKAELIEIPKKYSTGTLTKRSYKTTANKYDLAFGETGDEVIIKDVVAVFDNPNHAGYTRTISLALRHGAPVQYLVEQLQKDKEMDMFSFSKCIARCLKKYIADGTKASVNSCTNCGAEDTIIYQEGCQTCTACGYSACG